VTIPSADTSVGEVWNVTVKCNNTIGFSNYESIEINISIHSFEGIVKSAEGATIANATVVIVSQLTNASVGTTTTNESGNFNYAPPYPGNFSLCAWNPSNVTQGGDCAPFVEIT